MTLGKQLAAYLAETGARPLGYGRHDCVLWAAGWVRRRTGRDLLMGIRWRSLRDGLDQLRALGFDSPADAAAAQLPEVARLQARVGDIAEMDGAMGIVAGAQVAFLARRSGLEWRSLGVIERAFRVEV